MNAFSENPLFLFVDDLADQTSSNFATDGKIVELFDTGCDARMPGGALQASKCQEPGATIQGRGSTLIPNVRKPFSFSLGQNKSEITGTCKLPIRGKPMILKPKLKDTVPTKNDGIAEKAGFDPVVGYPNDAKGLGRKEAKSNVTNSSRMFSTYGGRNEIEKLQSISSSIPKQCKASSICSTLEGRAKTNTAKSVTNSRMTSPTKTSKVTSVKVLNHGVKKFVNRAVDKDSLSNCSRQLEVAKTLKSLSLSKTGYSSRLPRSTGAAKFLSKKNPPSESLAVIDVGKKASIAPETDISSTKIVRGTDHEHRGEGLQSKPMKTSPTVNLGKQRDRVGGETTSKGTLNANLVSVSERKHGYGVKTKLLKSDDLGHRNPATQSSSKSKITASKVPQPRFGRNLLIGDRSVQRREHLDKVSKIGEASDGQKSESNDLPSSEMGTTDKTECTHFDNKLSDNERPVTYSEKVPARPSAKCHNLISHKNNTNDKTMSFERELSEPRTPSIVPKLIKEFRLQAKRENEVRSVFPQAKIEGGKTKIDSNGKLPATSGLLSNQRNERRSRFSDRVQEVLGFKTPLLKEVTECLGTNLRSVDRIEPNNSKVNQESTSLSGVQAAHENDEEIELRSIYEDTPEIASHKSTVEPPVTLARTSNTNESKIRHPPFDPFASESKVPRFVGTKKIPDKKIARVFPDRKSPKKHELSTLRGPSKNFLKSGAKSEAKPSTPLTKKSLERVPESENVPKEDEDEDVIPIMNPALYNIRSFVTHHGERRNLEHAVAQKTVHGRKLESWMDGHEQAYLKGRAIGLRVASMARAAKEDLKREYFRTGLTSSKPMSLSDKSQEIVDIGISVLEKALAEKENKIHSPSVRDDRIFDYHDFDKKNTKWKTGQWFV